MTLTLQYKFNFVMPVKTGIHNTFSDWIPDNRVAVSGMTILKSIGAYLK